MMAPALVSFSHVHGGQAPGNLYTDTVIQSEELGFDWLERFDGVPIFVEIRVDWRYKSPINYIFHHQPVFYRLKKMIMSGRSLSA